MIPTKKTRADGQKTKPKGEPKPKADSSAKSAAKAKPKTAPSASKRSKTADQGSSVKKPRT